MLVDLDASLAFVEGVVSPNRRKFRQAGFWAFTGWCNPRLSMDKYPTTKKTPNALLKKISPGQNIRFHGHYTFCGSRHPINLDAMVANLTLEEGWTRATNIVDPIRLPKCHGKLPDGNFGGLDLQPRIGVMACFARTVPVAMDISDTSFLTVRHRADSDAV